MAIMKKGDELNVKSTPHREEDLQIVRTIMDISQNIEKLRDKIIYKTDLITNTTLHNDQLSWSANGVLTAIALSPNHKITFYELEQQTKNEDIAELLVAVDELKKHGYITIE
jgi:hypothetical protein